MENIFSVDKIKINEGNFEYNNTNPNKENKNENNKIDDIKKLNTLFVNRVNNNNNNYYVFQKKNNTTSEGFYLTSTGKKMYNNKARTNLISINKKNLFINVNNRESIDAKYEKNEKNDNNVDRILMDDQPVMNFSVNFNSELLLNNNNKNKNQEFIKKDLTLNYNINKSKTLNKKPFTKHVKNAKSLKHLENYFETPKKITNNYINYNYKNDNIKNNYFAKVKSSYKFESASVVSDSFNKFIPQKKLLKPNIVRNTINDNDNYDNYYNATLYNEQKTLNKIRSFGGLRITAKKRENILQKFFDDNTIIQNDKKNIYNYNTNTSTNNIKEKTDKKTYDNKTYDKKTKKNDNKKCTINVNDNINININESSNLMNDIGVLDLSCLKFCIFEEIIEKICKILKKNKIKFCFINQNKIHCSGKCGNFFDIEIYDCKNSNNKKVTMNKKKTNDNNMYKNNNNRKINNKDIIQKMGYTSLGFTKNNNGKNLNEEEKQIKNKEMYLITFKSKKNDFRKINEKLINDILY